MLTLPYFEGPEPCTVTGFTVNTLWNGCRVVGVAVPAGTDKWSSAAVEAQLGGGILGFNFPDDASQTGIDIDGATYDVYGSQNFLPRPIELFRIDNIVTLTFPAE